MPVDWERVNDDLSGWKDAMRSTCGQYQITKTRKGDGWICHLYAWREDVNPKASGFVSYKASGGYSVMQKKAREISERSTDNLPR